MNKAKMIALRAVGGIAWVVDKTGDALKTGAQLIRGEKVLHVELVKPPIKFKNVEPDVAAVPETGTVVAV